MASTELTLLDSRFTTLSKIFHALKAAARADQVADVPYARGAQYNLPCRSIQSLFLWG
jgi:hypothetical protein